MSKKLKKSIIASYFIGAPIGFFVVFATIYIPAFLLGEGLYTIAILGAYKASIIGLLVAFIVALGIGGKLAYNFVLKGKSLLFTSFIYSFNVNLIIWTVFIAILLFSSEEKLFAVIPAIIAFVLCTVLTTFSIGLLVSFIIKRIIF